MGYNVEGNKIGRNQRPGSSTNERLGIYVARVVNIEDATLNGRINVVIGSSGGMSKSSWIPVLQTTPFGGLTDWRENVDDIKAFGSSNEETAGGASKSYGMWTQPPAIGSRILIAYAVGDDNAYYLGSLLEAGLNFMIGGNASGLHHDPSQNPPYKPVSEINMNEKPGIDKRPCDVDMYNVLQEQGIDKDYARGPSSSSARREEQSRMFGITTRGGHTFTMDDGDKSGQNKNIRLRTRGGAQILIDDTNDFIFIINHAGTAWVEIDKTGKMDYYAKDDISFHTEGDFNVHAKGNFNLQSERQINMRSTGSGLGIRLDAASGDIDLYAARNQYHQSGQNSHMKAGGRYYETASRIDMNGPAAQAARRVQVHNHSQNKDVTKSASARVPEHHPWKGVTSKTEGWTVGKGKIK